MKLIKRYTNRKLYDTERSCYVTLDEIAEMVRSGEELSIVDNKTGEDLTTVTLAQIVFEEEKGNKKVLPLQSLRMMIQSPADLFARLSKPVNDFRDEAQSKFSQIRKNAEHKQGEFVSPLRDTVDKVQRSIDEMGNRMESRFKEAVDNLAHTSNLGHEVDDLRREVAELRALLTEARAQLGMQTPAAHSAADAPAESPVGAETPASE